MAIYLLMRQATEKGWGQVTLEQELDDARAEMIFREEQLHIRDWPGLAYQPYLEAKHVYDAARDRYLALLAEKRIRDLREVTA